MTLQNLRSDSCQEVFFTLYNELIRQKKQIILTSDTHPSEISSLTKRLISRFSSGLIVNISKPGAEHAKRILMKKIEGHEDVIDIDDDVLDFLARGYSDDVRALEGALNRLIFNATLFNPPTISMSFALGVLKDEPIISEPEQLNAKSIKKAVIRYYGLSYADLEGKSRQKKISQARQICIYLMRDMLQLPYAEIGSQLGNRDHTTISSSFSRAKKMIQKESTWKDAVDEIKRKNHINTTLNPHSFLGCFCFRYRLFSSYIPSFPTLIVIIFNFYIEGRVKFYGNFSKTYRFFRSN